MISKEDLSINYAPIILDSNKKYSKEELVHYIKTNQGKVVKLMLEFDNYTTTNTSSNLTTRQLFCLKNCSKEMAHGWDNQCDRYKQAITELLDFIDASSNESLSYHEVDMIKMMCSYLILRADEIVESFNYEK